MASHWSSRIAALALVAVLVGMAGLALWQRRDADRNIHDIRDAQALSQAYNDAHAEVLALEKALIVWAAEPNSPAVLRIISHADALDKHLRSIAKLGDADDKAFVAAVLAYGEASSPLLGELLAAPDPEAAYIELQPELGRLYDDLIMRVDAELYAEMEAPPSVSWAVVSPLATIIDRRAGDERTQLAAVTDQIEASWDSQTPFVIGGYALGTPLVLLLLWSTVTMSRREARTRAEVQSLRQAVTTDPLTNLGNRRGFEESLKAVAADPQPAQLCLAIMDLDEFKEANDTFGHDRGDAILRAFAELLREVAPEPVESYRIGGDEFALILPSFDTDAATALLEAVRAQAEERLGNDVTVSAGVAEMKGDEALLRQEADAALYEAKLRGRNLVVRYHDDGSGQPLFPAARLAAVRQLLVEGNVEPLFQPIWDLHRARLLAFEGLSRPAPKYGLAGPQQAFEIAEKFGRAAELDRICRLHILEAATALPVEADVFINLSPYTLTHHTFDPAHLIGETLRAGIDPGRIVYEITERSLVAPEAIARGARMLREAGFRVALDDVGAGNNGLEMLRKVEVDFVKVDRDVVIAAKQSGPGRAALMAILAFASESGALVVAEGVEDESMFGLVKEVAHATLRGSPGLIHGVQGYLFGRPAEAAISAYEPPETLAA